MWTHIRETPVQTHYEESYCIKHSSLMLFKSCANLLDKDTNALPALSDILTLSFAGFWTNKIYRLVFTINAAAFPTLALIIVDRREDAVETIRVISGVVA
jgi:hypothetical protein